MQLIGSQRNGLDWLGTQRKGSKADGKARKPTGRARKLTGRARNATERLFEISSDNAEIRDKYQTFRSYNFFISGLK